MASRNEAQAFEGSTSGMGHCQRPWGVCSVRVSLSAVLTGVWRPGQVETGDVVLLRLGNRPAALATHAAPWYLLTFPGSIGSVGRYLRRRFSGTAHRDEGSREKSLGPFSCLRGLGQRFVLSPRVSLSAVLTGGVGTGDPADSAAAIRAPRSARTVRFARASTTPHGIARVDSPSL